MLIQRISLAPNIETGRSISAPNPALARSSQTLRFSIESIETQKREKIMWNPGDLLLWRGIFRDEVWQAQTVIVVKDTPAETVVTLLPGTECMVEENYAVGKKDKIRRWDFREKQWKLKRLHWHTNRLLFLLEPQLYYSTVLFWHQESNKFLCYYINFQLPFRRNQDGIDTLDLDLDLIIHPDFSYEWKDVDDYQKAIEAQIILPEWIQGIEADKHEILQRLEKRRYPFDGSWLDWIPNPNWSPPKLPENWAKI